MLCQFKTSSKHFKSKFRKVPVYFILSASLKHRIIIMTRMDSARVKKYAKMAYTRFDMCVSTLFSPFAGVLYTVSALEKDPERPRSSRGSRSSSRTDRSLSPEEQSRANSRASSIMSEIESRPTSRASQQATEVIYCTYV